MFTVEFETSEERNELIQTHSVGDVILIGESHITEGKFLTFATKEEADARLIHVPTDKEIIGQQVVDLELQNLSLQNENQSLGQQLVDIDLRLLSGGL